MKQFLFLALLISAASCFADDAKNEWHNTKLNEKTIKQIQHAQFNYKKCVTEEMQKQDYAKIESRIATDAIIKRCEAVLGGMRKVYIDVGVPEVMADRHLKKMRIQVTRRVLQELMYQEAARAAGVK